MAVSYELRPGVRVQVNEIDLPLLRSARWALVTRKVPSGRVYKYVERAPDRALLHRVIMGAANGACVDHIDADGLNNTRENLRVCTHAENMRNRRPNAGKVLPKGVRQRGATFSAEIRAGAVRRRKCGFTTVEAAASTYAAWADELHGAFARTE